MNIFVVSFINIKTILMCFSGIGKWYQIHVFLYAKVCDNDFYKHVLRYSKREKKNLEWQFTFLLLLTLSLCQTIPFLFSSLYPWQWHLVFFLSPCITENVCFRKVAKRCRHFSFIPLPLKKVLIWYFFKLFLFKNLLS